MPHRAGVVLDEPIVSGGVGVAQFLPDPPLVVGPAADVAVPVAEQDQLRGRRDHAPVAEIVLVTDRPAEGWLGASTDPVDVHCADAAGDADFTRGELTDNHIPAFVIDVSPTGGRLSSFSWAIVSLLGPAEILEEVRPPTGLSHPTNSHFTFLNRVQPVFVVARVELDCQAKLLVVVQATDLVGHALGLGQGGEQQRG